jgi:hypothetical protein
MYHPKRSQSKPPIPPRERHSGSSTPLAKSPTTALRVYPTGACRSSGQILLPLGLNQAYRCCRQTDLFDWDMRSRSMQVTYCCFSQSLFSLDALPTFFWPQSLQVSRARFGSTRGLRTVKTNHVIRTMLMNNQERQSMSFASRYTRYFQPSGPARWAIRSLK